MVILLDQLGTDTKTVVNKYLQTIINYYLSLTTILKTLVSTITNVWMMIKNDCCNGITSTKIPAGKKMLFKTGYHES